jgi:uncharacterized membrane protein
MGMWAATNMTSDHCIGEKQALLEHHPPGRRPPHRALCHHLTMEAFKLRGRDARWWVTMIVIPAVLLAITLALPAVFAGRLPSPLATHWGAGRMPDGNMGLGTLLVVQVIIVGGTWGALAGYGRGWMPASPAVGTTYFLLGLFLAAQVSIVESNLDAATWAQAEQLGGGDILVVMLVSVVVGVAGFFLGGGTGNIPKREPGSG